MRGGCHIEGHGLYTCRDCPACEPYAAPGGAYRRIGFCTARQIEVRLDDRRCLDGLSLIRAANARAARAQKRRKELGRNDWSDIAAIYGVRIDPASMKTYNRGVIPGGCRTAAHRRSNA